VGGTFSGAISDLTSRLLNWSPFGTLYTIIRDALKDLGIELPKKFSEFGTLLIDSLIAGITNKATALKNSIKSIGDKLENWLRESVGFGAAQKLVVNQTVQRNSNLDMGMRNNRPIVDNRPTLINRTKNNSAPPLSIDNITVHAAPGMDEQQVARLVAQEITRQQNQAHTAQRSQFQDTD
jgi:hypothetical protein